MESNPLQSGGLKGKAPISYMDINNLMIEESQSLYVSNIEKFPVFVNLAVDSGNTKKFYMIQRFQIYREDWAEE